MKTISRYIMTLALLLTAVTGAWAQGYNVTFGGFSESEMNTTVNVASLPQTFTTIGHDALYPWTVISTSGNIFYNATVTSGGEGKVSANIANDEEMTITITGPFEGTATIHVTGEDDENRDISTDITVSCEAVGGTAPALTVAWDKATKTGTFTMPGSDVVLTPQYAPAAQLAENGAPAAVSGLEIAADAAIITAGQSAQGTLLYAVGTSETEKPALTAFAATLPNAKDQTAAGTYYVWYYIQGQDTPQGQEPTAENTFNDSEIMGPVMVELLTNEHTLNIKQSPNITVTVAGTAKTPTDDKVTPVTTGQEVKIKAKEGYKFRKVEVKKGAAGKTITIGDMELTYADGDTWETIVSKNSDKIKTLAGGYIVQVAQPEPNKYRYIKVVLSNKVNPSDIIDPSKNYEWGTIEVYS